MKESLNDQQKRNIMGLYDSNSSKQIDSAISDYDFPIFQDALLKDRSLKEGTQASSQGNQTEKLIHTKDVAAANTVKSSDIQNVNTEQSADLMLPR